MPIINNVSHLISKDFSTTAMYGDEMMQKINNQNCV
jgi:hypothetical protein